MADFPTFLPGSWVEKIAQISLISSLLNKYMYIEILHFKDELISSIFVII